MTAISITASGDRAVPASIRTNAEAVAIRLRNRLELQQGTWITDAGRGLPWSRWFEGRRPTKAAVAALARRQAQGVLGVLSVQDVRVSFDGSGCIVIDLQATADNGQIVGVQVVRSGD